MLYTCHYYYSAFKMKDTLPFATTQMNLEDSVLSEVRPTHRDKYCVISQVEPKNVELIKSGSRMVVVGGSGEREMGRCSSKGTVSVTQNKSLLQI